MSEPGPGEKGFIDTKSIRFDSRTKKGIKEMGKLFKQVGKIGNPAMMAASAFGDLVDKMGVMDAVMQGLSPIFDIISSLMTVLSNSIMQALMPAIQPLIDMMPQLIPIIQQIGQFIGETIAIGLEPLLRLIQMFLPIIEPLLPILFQLLELGLIPLQVIFEVIFQVLEPILPYLQDLADQLETLSPIIEQLTPIITRLIQWSFLPLVGAIYGIGIAIAALIDVFQVGTPTMDRWNALMLPILESLALGGGTSSGGGGGGGGGSSAPSSTPRVGRGERYASGGYQQGTELIIKSGLMPVEVGESIMPAGYRGTSEGYLEELVTLTRRKEMQDRRNAFFHRKGR